jgi:uncharacterized protein YbbC (DUF1343 family)
MSAPVPASSGDRGALLLGLRSQVPEKTARNGRMKVVAAFALAVLAACSVDAAPPREQAPSNVPQAAPVEATAALPRRVELGIEVLLERDSRFVRELEGKRLGLVTNPSGVDGNLVPTADRLAEDPRLTLVQLYGPEHGIRGDTPAGDSVGDALDPISGLPVQSLYGSRKAPTADTLENLDALVFDIQDIGSRTYTYISTLGEVMKAAAAAQKPLYVLDRPNPIGGLRFEGGAVEEQWKSFIGWGPVPVTHGLTVGEMARFYNEELALGCQLTVVPMRGWKRSMTWEDCGLEWTTTSPHVPHQIQAYLYVPTGMAASSCTNLSDAIGSTMPFEAIGAEWIDGYALAAELARERLEGVQFQPLAWKPFYGKWANKSLRGVRLVVQDSHRFAPLRTAIALLVTLRRMYGDALELADDAAIGKHWGSVQFKTLLLQGASVQQIEAAWEPWLAEFERKRQRVLIY